MGERDGEGLPWVYETAKMKICDIANGWKDKNLHFGVLFLRNLILIVKWQREVSERKMRNQVLSVHFLPLQEQGASVLVPHPLVPQHLPVKWELLNLPLNAKFYHVCKNWGPSRGKQSIASGGILWSSLELEKGMGLLRKRVLSQLQTILSWQLQR